MTRPSPFRYFKTSPEFIRLAVMMYIRLSQPQDGFHDQGVHELPGREGSVRVFGPLTDVQ
jgi:hypothetical protein